MTDTSTDGTDRCHDCDTRIPPNGGIESPFSMHPEGTQYCHDCIATPRVAFVGCGASKIDTDEPVPAQDLYDSNYFELKQEFAETCDGWYIVSAEHGVMRPDDEIEPYDTTISDLSDYELGKWSVRVTRSIATRLSFWNVTTTAVFLMGSDYIEHIDEDEAICGIRQAEKPFDETSGIGEQMGWLREKIDTHHPPGQAGLDHYAVADGGQP